MPNKALRILIADEQHFFRMNIERMLNQLGYYRVAPVHSIEDFLVLVEYGCEPFDLLLINASLTASAHLDPLAFCLDNPQVRHALIYDGQQAQLPAVPAWQRRKVQVSQAPMPDLAALKRVMALVDGQRANSGSGEVAVTELLSQKVDQGPYRRQQATS